MRVSQRRRAVRAAESLGAELGLAVDEAVVLHDSNKLTLRLRPCDIVARVAPAEHGVARLELDLAARLAAEGCPVAAPDPRAEPRVHARDGFDITLWTYYEPIEPQEIAPWRYAAALELLHAGMRRVEIPTPHFTDRVEAARSLVADHRRTPELVDDDRELLADTLRGLGSAVGRRGAEQLLHGEPHPGNLLAARDEPMFIDFETCCRGPIEFDLAHAPDRVADRYPGVDRDLLRECRILVLAMVTTWRWDRDDQLPDGHRLAGEWLARIRAELGR